MKFQEIVFIQYVEAEDVLEMINHWEYEQAIEYLKQWDYGDGEIGDDKSGNSDSTKIIEEYLLSWNRNLNYVSLQRIVGE